MINFLWGLGGMLVILGIAYLFSNNRKAINWRTVLGALAIQFLFAVIVLFTGPGKFVLQKMSEGIQDAIDTSGAGIDFLFGGVLAIDGIGMVFAFQVLPIIIFFSAVISILYHFGIMQFIVRYVGGGISRLLGTSQAESISAAANVFVGQTEAPLLVKPYLNKMTTSELFAVMTGGMATVAGSVMAGYAAFGIPLEYLLAATFMAAPGGLLMAKMLVPETEVSETQDNIKMDRNTGSENVVDAAAGGALDGLKLALNVAAMLVAFVSLIALINLILGAITQGVGLEDITLERMLGWIFSPFAFIIGIPWEEAMQAGSFIGEKTIANEFIAFQSLIEAQAGLSDRTFAITTFALCGFANIGSVAILLGGLGALAPDRRATIAKYGFKALLAATLVNLMNAVIAGMLI